MAVLKVPRITATQRSTLLLTEGEIVFDTDEKIFYGGNGTLVGGFPIGSGVTGASIVDVFTLTSTDITNKYVTLSQNPNSLQSILLFPEGGILQTPGLDFTLLSGNVLSWDGFGLDNFLEVGERITVSY